MCRMESNQKSLRQWVLLVFNCAALCIGGTAGSLITRFYFMHGGNCKWLIAWLQTAGCPLLILPIWISSIIIKSSENESTHVTPKLCLASIVLGLLTGLHNFLYSWGIAYLPLSTATLLVSPQLAFIAIFAFFLVKQRFTPFSINALVLLTMAAITLALHASGDRPEGVTSTQYWLGFFSTGGGAALYGFILPLIEFVYRKSTRRITYIVIMEMQVIMSISATLFCTLGMLVNKDFQALGREGRSFDVGEFNYYMSLVWNAICWQLYFIGLYGVIFLTSSLLSGVFMASLTPLVEVLSVVILHEKFRGEKVMAFALALWGFTSYLFGEYKSSTLQTSNTSEEHAHCHPHEGLQSTEIEEIDERTSLLGIEEGSYPHYA